MQTPVTIEPAVLSLNESPSEKEGKFAKMQGGAFVDMTLNESPSEKEGKSLAHRLARGYSTSPQ